MAKNPAFQFYAQDFLTDTYQWTLAQKGLHCELLSVSWINGFLEADGCGFPLGLSDEGKKLWNEKVGFKWVLKDGKLYNLKLEEVRNKKQKFHEKQAENGKKGGRPKKENPKETQTQTQNISQKKPLEDEYEEEISISNNRGVQGGFGLYSEDLDEVEVGGVIEFMAITAKRRLTPEQINQFWKAFLIHSNHEYHRNRPDKLQHFRNWLKKQPDETKSASNSNKSNTASQFDRLAAKVAAGLSQISNERAEGFGS